MRILLWHVHGSWTTGFVHGGHDYVVPVLPDRGPDGVGRARTYAWPDEVRELPPEALADEPFDLVLLQRPHELELATEWLGGRRPGRDVPAVYVEHNAPQGRIAELVHPARDWGVPIVHVTHFNRLMWDCGTAPTHVIEHGIVDPGHRYTGELARVAAVANEARRRGRVTGTDLILDLRERLPLDLFGIDAESLGGVGDLPHADLHREMARRRVYVHLNRWTSLGLSLLEAMQLGMPVVALSTTEAPEAIPADVATVTNRPDVIEATVRELLADPDLARERGARARAHALERFGLDRFLVDWDALLADLVPA
ncbi:glycosyltransferase [Patulibacter sp. SYSU D01012]|uniref:glycosyltransferase n=1 Tax=Patulibacter sp. SYSU D01012 TaxID=2817381 RepID=UPI001B30D7A8